MARDKVGGGGALGRAEWGVATWGYSGLARRVAGGHPGLAGLVAGGTLSWRGGAGGREGGAPAAIDLPCCSCWSA